MPYNRFVEETNLILSFLDPLMMFNLLDLFNESVIYKSKWCRSYSFLTKAALTWSKKQLVI